GGRLGWPPTRAGSAGPGDSPLLGSGSRVAAFTLGDLDELVGTAFLRPRTGVGDCPDVDLDGTDGVIVAGNHVVDAVRVGVGIHHADDRDTELVRLVDRDTLVIHVDDEQRIGQAAHFLDAADGTLELVLLAG